MIKKTILLFLLFAALTSGFLSANSSYTLRLVPPHSQAPLQGTWKISAVLQENNATSEQWLGQTLLFTDDYVLLGNYLLPQPRFQLKRVAASSYLDTKQPSFSNYYTQQKELEVLTLSDQHLFYCELQLQGEEGLILHLFNNSYLVRKISDNVDKSQFNSPEITEITNMTNPQQANLQSGVLLGLRSVDNHYRTLWLAADDRKLAPLLQIETLIFPRRNGFYELQVAAIEHEHKREDFLLANPLSGHKKRKEPQLALDPLLWENRNGSIQRKITYIGNDFVSLEENVDQTTVSGSIHRVSRLLTLSVDSLPAIKAVKISDLVGPESAVPKQANQLPLADPLAEENFSLARKKGYWQFISRLPDGSDVPLGIIPPSHILFYNELTIPWPRVKNHSPQAYDVLTSPNEDLALVFTNSEIIVYAMYHHNLAAAPLLKVPLQEGEELVMTEWALNHYVENWTLTMQSLL